MNIQSIDNSEASGVQRILCSGHESIEGTSCMAWMRKGGGGYMDEHYDGRWMRSRNRSS